MLVSKPCDISCDLSGLQSLRLLHCSLGLSTALAAGIRQWRYAVLPLWYVRSIHKSAAIRSAL